jgi:hypothetical protein
MLGYDPLATIRSQIQRYLFDSGTTTTATLNRSVNDEYQALVARHQWPQLLRVDKSGLRAPSDSNLKTIEAADEFVPMPFTSGRLLSLSHQTAVSGRTMLEAKDPQAFSEIVGNRINQSGVPAIYRYVGQTAQVRKAAAGTPTLTCTVSGNDNVREVMVRLRSSAAAQLDTQSKVVVSGVFSAGVSLGLAIGAGYDIEAVSVPSGWVGNLRITDSAGTLIVNWNHYEVPTTATTTDKEVISRQLVEVWPIPVSDYPLTVHWYRDPRALTADEDVPEIPVSGYLIDAVAANLLEQAGRHKDAQARRYSAEKTLRALTGQHKQDAPRVARPYGGNLLGATGVDY